MGASTDHVQRNREVWDKWAADFAAPGEENWADPDPTWGVWGISNDDATLLPADLTGRDAIELGCGTAYVGSWMARRGARVTGIDNSAAQLATARRLQRQHGRAFPLLQADAELAPFPDGSFDFAISEYGASIWADPYRWVPEAARLLRSGGRLVFLVNSHLLALCMPPEDDVAATDRLLRPAFGLHRVDWPDGSINFYLPHGGWIRLLRRCGFEIEDLIELRPAPDASSRYPFVTRDWARRWPCEEVWIANRR